MTICLFQTSTHTSKSVSFLWILVIFTTKKKVIERKEMKLRYVFSQLQKNNTIRRRRWFRCRSNLKSRMSNLLFTLYRGTRIGRAALFDDLFGYDNLSFYIVVIFNCFNFCPKLTLKIFNFILNKSLNIWWESGQLFQACPWEEPHMISSIKK
jgi:hypothetical protein